MCFGAQDGSATVVPIGGTASYTYLWNDNQTTQTAFGLGSGNYAVTITDDNGCQIVAAISLTQPPLITASLDANDVICYGESNGSLLVLSSSGGTGMLDYSLDGINYQVDSIFNGLLAGMYTVYVRDDNGCVYEFVQSVAESAELVVDAGPNVMVQLGDSIQLDGVANYNGPLTWTWETNDFLSCNDCPNPWVLPLNTITYQLMALDSNGCEASDEVTITVQIDRNVFIPNIFTPNQDGINDVFHAFGGPDVASIRTMNIYDRWGEPVFEANDIQPNDPSMGWDGRFRDQKMASSVFVYYIVVEFIDGYEREYKGDFTLIR